MITAVKTQNALLETGQKNALLETGQKNALLETGQENALLETREKNEKEDSFAFMMKTPNSKGNICSYCI